MKTMYQLGLALISTVFFLSCGGGASDGFPPVKKYWTAEDYNVANVQLSNLKAEQKELPNLDDPKTSGIFNKIVDTNNVSVVANDSQLGTTHRETFLNDIFL